MVKLVANDLLLIAPSVKHFKNHKQVEACPIIVCVYNHPAELLYRTIQ